MIFFLALMRISVLIHLRNYPIVVILSYNCYTIAIRNGKSLSESFREGLSISWDCGCIKWWWLIIDLNVFIDLCNSFFTAPCIPSNIKSLLQNSQITSATFYVNKTKSITKTPNKFWSCSSHLQNSGILQPGPKGGPHENKL